VTLQDLDGLLLAPGDVGLLPGRGSPTSVVLDEQVTRANLIVVRRGLRRGFSGGVGRVGEVLGPGEGGEVGRGEFGRDFPLALLGRGVVEVRALARVRETDLCGQIVRVSLAARGVVDAGEGGRMTESGAGGERRTDPRVDPVWR
jgi:hypothetical protein